MTQNLLFETISSIDGKTIFSYSNIGIKRPQKGKKPLEIWKLIGKTAKRSYKKNELL